MQSLKKHDHDEIRHDDEANSHMMTVDMAWALTPRGVSHGAKVIMTPQNAMTMVKVMKAQV